MTLTGTGFVTGAAVTLGGAAATSTSVVNDTTITATTAAHAAGAVDVVVTNPDTQQGTLAGGFTYVVCAVTIDPTSTTPGAAGGPASVAVTANAADCGWTAVSNDAWVTVDPGSASGTGNGTVNYHVALNQTNLGRTGTVTIGGQTLTVQQAAANAVPGPPNGLAGSSTGSSISLSWNAPSSGGLPAAYTIEAGSGPGLSNLANFSTGNTLTTFFANGIANGLYFIRVRASNASGTSPASNEVPVRIGPAPPNAPTGLTASSSGSSITLAWTAPAGGGVPAGYLIEAGSAPGLSDLANIATGNTLTTFTASGVANGTYYVRVRATNAGGTSAPSNEAILQVGPPPPGPPSGLTAGSVGSTVTLSWNAPSTGGPPTSYTIEAGSGPGLANLANVVTGNTLTTFSAGGVLDGGYYLRVRASNPYGTSAASNEALMYVGCPGPPGAPTILTSTVGPGGSLQITWTAASASPTTYVLDAGSSPGLADLASLEVGNTLVFNTSGVPNGTYYIHIHGRNACGLGATSNVATVVVQ